MALLIAQDDLETRARDLGESLSERGWMVGTAESCTGGWIAQTMTAVAGSSDWFESGLVTYSNAAKSALLHVKGTTLAAYGAVSEQTAAEMAEGVLGSLAVDCSISVTGVAGPSGGTDDKPVGMVCFGFAVNGRKTVTATKHFEGDRRAVRAQSVAFALEQLLQELA